MNIVIVDTDHNFSISLAQYLKGTGNIDTVGIFNDALSAVSFFQSKETDFEFVLFDLSVPNLNLDSFVRSAPSGTIFLAMTGDSEMLYEYNNYPYFQRLFFKPISFSSFLNYLVFQSDDIINTIRSFMVQTLSDVGFNINHSGTVYLIEATILVIRKKITKLTEVYSILACTSNTSPKIIGWSINNAINHAIKRGNEYKIQSFFKTNTNQKLSAKYIINYFANSFSTKPNSKISSDYIP